MEADVLVPEDALRAVDDEAAERTSRLDPPVNVDVRAGDAGRALARSLLFEHWPDLVDAAEDLGDAARFYNRYFWFVRFVALHQATHGPDAGLDQQAFKILDEAPADVDWSVVEQLDTTARTLDGSA